MADEPPLYDGTQADPGGVVRVEMWCACGMAHRQRDPLGHCLPVIDGFRARHTGDGHRATDPDTAVAEREARREAALRAVGRHGEYRARDRELTDGSWWDWSGEPAPASGTGGGDR